MQQEIILLEKVNGRGAVGDIVKVRTGFANYLVRFQKAKFATKQAKSEFEQQKSELIAKAEQKLAEAKVIAQKLEGAVIKISRQAGLDGRLFGSVTNFDIMEELKKNGYTNLVKNDIYLPNGALKTTGEHDLSVRLHVDVTANIRVKIIGAESL